MRRQSSENINNSSEKTPSTTNTNERVENIRSSSEKTPSEGLKTSRKSKESSDNLPLLSLVLPDEGSTEFCSLMENEISPKASILGYAHSSSRSTYTNLDVKTSQKSNRNYSPRAQISSNGPASQKSPESPNNYVTVTNSTDEGSETEGHFEYAATEVSDEEILTRFLRLSNSLNSLKTKVYQNQCTLLGCFLFMAVSITVILLTVIPCDTLAAFERLASPNSYFGEFTDPTYATLVSTERTFRIALLGDSLINKPFTEYNLGGIISDLLPQYDLEIKNCGFNGATINNIITNHLVSCALSIQPDVVILFWDSDVSSVDEVDFSEEEVTGIRDNYIGNISYVIETIQKNGSHMMLAGPGLLGETKAGMLSATSLDRFNDNYKMLIEYTTMNEEVSLSYNVTYINVRDKLVASVPPYQLCRAGNLLSIAILIYSYPPFSILAFVLIIHD